jgi:hypothetical protein
MIDPATKKEYACPLNGKLCVDGVREDFPTNSVGGKVPCRWWQHVAGKDPQGEKTIDAYDCAVAWMPMIGIEGSQMSRQTAASVDKVANAVAEVKGNINALSGTLRIAAAEIRQGIEAGAIQIMLPPGTKNGEEKPDAD